jgi:hypothetical protein
LSIPVGWAPELIIDGESGFLVHPQNHSHYANMIILKDTNLCLTMGKMQDNGSRMFFDIEKIAQQNIVFINL